MGYIRHQVFRRAIHFAHAHSLRPVSHLTVQVGDLYRVAVHETQSPYSRSGKVRSSRTPKSSTANNKHLRPFQSQLSMQAHLRQDHLASISLVLFRFQRPPPVRRLRLSSILSGRRLRLRRQRCQSLIDPVLRQTAGPRLLQLTRCLALLFGLLELELEVAQLCLGRFDLQAQRSDLALEGRRRLHLLRQE